MRYNPIRSRRLPEKSKLVFEFPKPSVGGDKYVVTLPFFENISINERKRANYKKYNLLSRSSQLYTYTGSDSRRFALDFHMSYPHILEEHGDQAIGNFIKHVDTEDPSFIKKAFIQGDAGAFLGDGIGGLRTQARTYADRLKFGPAGPSEEEDTLLDDALDVIGFLPNLLIPDDNPPPEGSRYDKLIDMVLYWTNIIRSSVSNNSKNPVYGPPIVRINHGVLFQDIPCICTDYSVAPVEEAGYDLDTLMPRRIAYRMNLEEIRAGDFQKFRPSDQVKKDNLVGWEGVVSNYHQSMDPGYRS